MTLLVVDRIIERLARNLAGGLSRRSLLARLGAALVVAPSFPLLPINRASAADSDSSAQAKTAFARAAQATDENQCNYWRYCAIDGALCSCCGGGVHTCPPGTQPSPTSWVGSCVHPNSGKTFLIAYHDCCGTVACNQCNCASGDRATQSYRPQTNGDILWCFGLSGMQYHCSTAVLVGEAN
jgi:methylamine dehydrogenase light chain